MFRFIIIIAVLFEFCSCSNKETESKLVTGKDSRVLVEDDTPQVSSKTSQYFDSLGLVDIAKRNPDIAIDLKYATTDNFTKKILYKDLTRAYLHPFAMDKLDKAYSILKAQHPDLNLLIYDVARPLSVQKEMYNAVQNTRYKAYVADPSKTGLHNYGMAIDLTICDSLGQALDMGTEFDHFGKKAGINNEELFISQGILTQKQVDNRRLLREVMLQAGFLAIRGEWWHFNACSLNEARRHAVLIK